MSAIGPVSQSSDVNKRAPSSKVYISVLDVFLESVCF
jgi:hypothetical protein